MRRFFLTILILAAAAALAFVSAPWFALRGLQSAARDGDVQALAELIDYPSVRAGLRAQATPEPPPPRPACGRTRWAPCAGPSSPCSRSRRPWSGI
jgi:hypothetical protein